MTRSMIAAVAFLLASSTGGGLAHALYCADRIIQTGDSTSRVEQHCGEPTEVVRRTETRMRTVHRQLPGGVIVSDTISYTVLVEQWVYDFGRTRFVQRMLFEDGVLLRIDAGGYGTSDRSAP